MALTSTLKASISCVYSSDTAASSLDPSVTETISYSKSMTSGTGANQADQIWNRAAALLATANYDIDMAGVVVDCFGSTLTGARVKAILVKNTSDVEDSNAAIITFGGGGATEWVGATALLAAAGDKLYIKAGGAVAFFAPDATAYVVGAGATDILRLTGDAVLDGHYDITIVMSSA
jgi:hypothetical protein